MSGWRLTVRHGARVRHESFESLDEAIAAAEEAARETLAEGPLGSVKMLREFEPGQRVAARLEISTGGWLRGRAAGVDVMGDGSVVAYSGAMRREPLETRAGESAFDAVRGALSG